MAHFAEINEEGIVQRVIVVGDGDTADAGGNEVESIGAEFCNNLLGGTWKQTSYNGNQRYNYAGVGHRYDADSDAFIAPQPFESWNLDEQMRWVAPVAMPIGGVDEVYLWDEESLNWVARKEVDDA